MQMTPINDMFPHWSWFYWRIDTGASDAKAVMDGKNVGVKALSSIIRQRLFTAGIF